MKITSTILGILLLGTSTLMAQGYKSQGAAPRENQDRTNPRLDQGRSYAPYQYNQQQQQQAYSQQYDKPDNAAVFDGPVFIITPRGRTVQGEIYNGVFQMGPKATAILKQDYYDGPNGGTMTINLPLDMQIIVPASNINPVNPIGPVNFCLLFPALCRLCNTLPCPPLSDYIQKVQGTQVGIVTSDGRQVTAVFDSKGQLQADYQTKQILTRALQEGSSFTFYFQDGIVVNMGPNAVNLSIGSCFPIPSYRCLIWLGALFLL